MDSTSTLEAPTTELTAPLATTNTDRCPNCGAQMAADQRYCIECGERRTGGGLRDSLPRTQAVAPAPSPRRRAWLSANNSLIAGIATLLLAMGVGVLIGRSGDNGGGRAATPQIVTVSAGAGGAAANGASTGTTSANSARSTTSSKKSRKSSSKAKVTGAGSIDATAKKNGVKLPPKVVKVGQACAKGTKGCSAGKFTGDYFGGG